MTTIQLDSKNQRRPVDVAVEGNELIRSLRRSPKHFAKLRSRLLTAGVSDREIIRAMANSRALISPTKLIGGRTR